jgi:hypothetical protein
VYVFVRGWRVGYGKRTEQSVLRGSAAFFSTSLQGWQWVGGWQYECEVCGCWILRWGARS